MNSGAEHMQYRRLRAPRSHGKRLIDPPLADVPAVVARNHAHRPAAAVLFGQSLPAIASRARRDLLDAARRYTAAYRALPATHRDEHAPLVMAGHQPVLFHPGVWFKNFVLDQVARNLNANAVNLLIDNDVSPHSAIRVPTGSAAAPHVVTIAYDRPQPGVALEECRLHDTERFASFGGQVAEAVRPFSSDPLVAELWPLAQSAARRTDRTHQCLAEARHRIEQKWGLETLELPLSEVCRQPAFRMFMAHLLLHMPRFQVEHNAALGAYRAVNRVRSKTHPVPALARHDQWLETPFWIWTRDDPRRRPLFVRLTDRNAELSDRDGLILPKVPLHADGNAEEAVSYFANQERRGVKIRPRALMTTMFCRLFLSDLFIHGIGGAKYDQLTDDLIRRFFGCSAPGFLVVTATANLPITREPVSANDLGELRQRARDLRFHPERFVEKTPATKPLIEEKQNWIRGPVSDPRQRHLAITRVNARLASFLGKTQAQTAERIAHVTAALARERILASREYSFCLFSHATLQPLLLDI